MQLAKSQHIVLHMPRVNYLEQSQRCEANVGNRSTLKMRYHPNAAVRKEAQRKARCKNNAHWQFRFLKRSTGRGKTTVVCWKHLIHRCLYGDMLEEAATEAWVKRHEAKKDNE